MSQSSAVTIEPHAEAVRAVISQPRLDETNIDKVQEEITAAAAQKPGLPVVLDLLEVDYIPSVGLGGLVGLMKRLRADGHRFILTGLQGEVRMLLSITRLDKLFEIRTTFDDALQHIREQG
jgi:anti-anti-sigma factor